MKESPELYRLINARRRLKDLLMSRRLAVDPERTGVVELADFGKRCDALAAFARETQEEFAGRVVGTVAEEIELAARLASSLETLPRTPERLDRQTRLLEEVARLVAAALDADLELNEAAVLLSLSTLAQRESELFAPLFSIEGVIHESAPGMIVRGPVLRALRRALLDHDEESAFRLEVDEAGTLRFGDFQITAEVSEPGVPRTRNEPPDVKRALDMYEGTRDEALRSFLLVKAVDEALAALLGPMLSDAALVEKARSLPQKPGKGYAVRPEAVQRGVEGWNNADALRVAEKLAARRLGPDAARLPKGAYLLRLFLSEDDRLAADLLVLGTALKRMGKGSPVEGTDDQAIRALRALLGLLG